MMIKHNKKLKAAVKHFKKTGDSKRLEELLMRYSKESVKQIDEEMWTVI